MFTQITEKIYLCGRQEANSTYFINTYRPKTIINFDQLEDEVLDKGTQYIHLSLEDSRDGNDPEQFKRAIDMIDVCEKPVFIHCAAGISRSPTVLALYLSQRTDMFDQQYGPEWAFEYAFDLISGQHKIAQRGGIFYFVKKHVVPKLKEV